MWATDAWMQRGGGRQDCWRWTQWGQQQTPRQYFYDTWQGAHCDNNWYSGNPNMWWPPEYTTDAPAVFGFDESIDEFCSSRPKKNERFGSAGWPHANNCIRSNLNILSLYDGTYNICRNLEWMVCAAKGKLPGQRTDTILFAKAPKELDPSPVGSKPFGRCSGFREPEHPELNGCDVGYATDDIFYLETCIYNQICDNHDELFRLRVGKPFHCQLNQTKYIEMQHWLLAKPDFTSSGNGETHYKNCAEWCNAWNCAAVECSGCPRELFKTHNCRGG